jgi:hypothetical protein
MQSIKRPKNKKPLVILVAIVALTLLIAAAYFLIVRPLTNPSNTTAGGDLRQVNDVNYDPPTDQEKQDSERIKQETEKNEQARQNPPQTQSSSSSPIVITISRAGQVDNSISVRTIIDGAKTGDCTATFTRGSDTVTKTSSIVFEVNSYTCNIDIPTSDFNASGTWSMSVIAKSGSTNSQAATQPVTITK